MPIRKSYEAEADYLGVYLAERAGYDVTVAPDLWRRMGIENTDSIAARYGATHPSTPERSVALSEAIHEIGVKNIEGLALMPNRLDSMPESVEGQSGEMIADQPRQSGGGAIGLSSDPDMGTGRFVIPDPPEVGKWAFVAESYAVSNGCMREDGGRPQTELVGKTNYYETYRAECVDTAMEFRCELGGCGN